VKRPRYPSDDKRLRQRPHVKIHLSVRTHRKTVGHFDGAEFRGQFLALMMVAAEAFAGRAGGKLHLGPADIAWISGKRRPDVASTSVQRLLNVLEYSFERRGDVIVTSIPKFSKKQGYGSADGGGTPRSPETPKEPKNQGTKEPNIDSPAPRSAERSVSSKGGLTTFPKDTTEIEDGLHRWWLKHPEHGPPNITHAIDKARDWAEGKGHKRKSWLAVIRNGVRDGWLQPKNGAARGNEKSSAVKDSVRNIMRTSPSKERRDGDGGAGKGLPFDDPG